MRLPEYPVPLVVVCCQDDYEERRVRHEAAHFLSGYLCGLPIKSYKADGGTTLVEFYDSAEGDISARAKKFTPEEVDQVSSCDCWWLLLLLCCCCFCCGRRCCRFERAQCNRRTTIALPPASLPLGGSPPPCLVHVVSTATRTSSLTVKGDLATKGSLSLLTRTAARPCCWGFSPCLARVL